MIALLLEQVSVLYTFMVQRGSERRRIILEKPLKDWSGKVVVGGAAAIQRHVIENGRISASAAGMTGHGQIVYFNSRLLVSTSMVICTTRHSQSLCADTVVVEDATCYRRSDHTGNRALEHEIERSSIIDSSFDFYSKALV